MLVLSSVNFSVWEREATRACHGHHFSKFYNQSVKNDRFIAVAQDAMFEVPHYTARQHRALQIAAFFDQILNLVPMRNADYILFDDRTVIERRRDIVAGGADQF